MKKFINEFKKFALKGSVIDLAIGIMIGTAFNKIVSALVDDILMPPFGLLFGTLDFSSYKLVLRQAVTDTNGQVTVPSVTISYGHFIQTTIDFLIIALSIFVAIKFVNKLRDKEQKKEKPAEQKVVESKEAAYLKEIRDLLKEQKSAK